MQWKDNGEKVVEVKPRRESEGARKLQGGVEWWELMRRKSNNPRETKARFGKRIRAFATVEWCKADGDVVDELQRICDNKIKMLRAALAKMGGERQGDDLNEKMRAATAGRGGGMMREIFLVGSLAILTRARLCTGRRMMYR